MAERRRALREMASMLPEDRIRHAPVTCVLSVNADGAGVAGTRRTSGRSRSGGSRCRSGAIARRTSRAAWAGWGPPLQCAWDPCGLTAGAAAAAQREEDLVFNRGALHRARVEQNAIAARAVPPDEKRTEDVSWRARQQRQRQDARGISAPLWIRDRRSHDVLCVRRAAMADHAAHGRRRRHHIRAHRRHFQVLRANGIGPFDTAQVR